MKCEMCNGIGGWYENGGVFECETCEGTGVKRMSEKMKAKLDARIQACYFEQIIDEACNADFGFNNNFRRVMTVGDCVEAHRQKEVWERVAEIY